MLTYPTLAAFLGFSSILQLTVQIFCPEETVPIEIHGAYETAAMLAPEVLETRIVMLVAQPSTSTEDGVSDKSEKPRCKMVTDCPAIVSVPVRVEFAEYEST